MAPAHVEILLISEHQYRRRAVLGRGSVEPEPQLVCLWIALRRRYVQAIRLRRPTLYPLSYRRAVSCSRRARISRRITAERKRYTRPASAAILSPPRRDLDCLRWARTARRQPRGRRVGSRVVGGSAPIWYGWREGASHHWCGDRGQSDVWEVARPSESPLHPTMKPLNLVERAIANSSRNGDVVLDPFCGSGSTLIAAERTGRVCAGIELDPVYVDVAVARW